MATDTAFVGAFVVAAAAGAASQISPGASWSGWLILVVLGILGGAARVMLDAEKEDQEQNRRHIIVGATNGLFFCLAAHLLIDLWPLVGGMVNGDAPRPEPVTGWPRYGLPMIVGYAHAEASTLLLAIFGFFIRKADKGK